MKKTYVVIGLGRFGTAIASRLYALGNEVLAIDTDAAKVQHAEPFVTYAVIGDARDEAVLKSLGVWVLSLDRVFCHEITTPIAINDLVAIGKDLATSVIVTLNLKDLNIPVVICKATDEIQKKALEKVGADRVVVPEREMGVKLAQALTSSSVLDFIELSSDYGIAEVAVPEKWIGKTLRELNLRAKYGTNIIAIRDGASINVTPDADLPLKRENVLVAVGRNEQLSGLQK